MQATVVDTLRHTTAPPWPAAAREQLQTKSGVGALRELPSKFAAGMLLAGDQSMRVTV
jgi:hypothetical protein